VNNYQIIQAHEVSRSDWQDYVSRHPYGSIFHTPYLFDVYNATPNFKSYAFFAVDENGSINALLSGFLQTVKSGLASKLSTRSVLMHSPLFNDHNSFFSLLGYYNKWVKGKAIYTEIRNHYIDEDYSRCILSYNYNWEGHYNIVKEIPSNTDELWKQIGRKRKDGINKGKRYDFEISEDNSERTVTNFYNLLTDNYSKLSLPIPKRLFFENCVSQDRNGYCKFFELNEDGITKIVLLSFLYKSTLFAVYIGSDQDPEFIRKRPIDYFYYKVMCWCADNGVKYFDWLGAGKPNVSYGVRDFKLQYGGELVDFGRFQMIHSPLGFKIAETGFKFIQKLKGKI